MRALRKICFAKPFLCEIGVATCRRVCYNKSDK